MKLFKSLLFFIILSLVIKVHSAFSIIKAREIKSYCDKNLYRVVISIDIVNPLKEYITFFLTAYSKENLLFKCLLNPNEKQLICTTNLQQYKLFLEEGDTITLPYPFPDVQGIIWDYNTFLTMVFRKRFTLTEECGESVLKTNISNLNTTNWDLILKINKIYDGQCLLSDTKDNFYTFKMNFNILGGNLKKQLDKSISDKTDFEINLMQNITMPFFIGPILSLIKSSFIYETHEYYKLAFCYPLYSINVSSYLKEEGIDFRCDIPISEQYIFNGPLKIRTFSDNVYAKISEGNEDDSIEFLSIYFTTEKNPILNENKEEGENEDDNFNDDDDEFPVEDEKDNEDQDKDKFFEDDEEDNNNKDNEDNNDKGKGDDKSNNELNQKTKSNASSSSGKQSLLPQSSPSPVQSSPSPVQSSKPPVQSSPSPAQPSKPPVQSSKPPVQSSPSPVQSSKPPVQSSPSPAQPSKPPVQSSKPPVQSSPSPVQSSKPPVQSSLSQSSSQKSSPSSPLNLRGLENTEKKNKKKYLLLDDRKTNFICPDKPVFEIVDIQNGISYEPILGKPDKYNLILKGYLKNGYKILEKKIVPLEFTTNEIKFNLSITNNLIEEISEKKKNILCNLNSGTLFLEKEITSIKCIGDRLEQKNKDNTDITVNWASKENKYLNDIVIKWPKDFSVHSKKLYSYSVNVLSIQKLDHDCFEEKYYFYVNILDLKSEPQISFQFNMLSPSSTKAFCKLYSSKELKCYLDLRLKKIKEGQKIRLPIPGNYNITTLEGNYINFTVLNFTDDNNTNFADDGIEAETTCGNNMFVGAIQDIGYGYGSAIAIIISILVIFIVAFLGIGYCVIFEITHRNRKGSYYSHTEEKRDTRSDVSTSVNPINSTLPKIVPK